MVINLCIYCSQKNSNPLDSLLIHPESYELAASILKATGQRKEDVGKQGFISHFKQLLESPKDLKPRRAQHTESDTQLILDTLSHNPESVV